MREPLPRLLYHGTSAAHLPAIVAKGLRPRRAGPGNWGHTIASGADRVYLTSAYSLYYAAAAADGGAGAVLEIDTRGLRPANFVPDVDVLEHTGRGRDGIPGNINCRSHDIIQRATSDQLRFIGKDWP